MSSYWIMSWDGATAYSHSLIPLWVYVILARLHVIPVLFQSSRANENERTTTENTEWIEERREKQND